ncbi:MAG: hypothetical protein MUO62_12050 [Anaerolineales bacterium]|nr:hypothetical protein [Anaerolineales bacterium]
MDKKLQIPFAVDLTDEKGWSQQDKYLYFIARFNLHIEDEQNDELSFGDILRTYHTTDFSETEVVKGFEEECTVVDVKETTRTMLFEHELSARVSSSIAGAITIPLYEVSSEIGASLEHSIRSSMEQSLKSAHSISKREKKSFTVSQKIKSGAKELHFAVACYRKYSQKVFLHYIDYLFVEYKTTALGLRKKKTNLPRPIGVNHINRFLVNIPLFKMDYWQLESESSLLFTETEYKQLPKVKHPDRIIFEELHEEIWKRLPLRPDKPTLYTLSNIAFPLRWINRKGPWTKEELQKIELDEAEGSAWWFQYGQGRKNRK